MNRLGGTYDKLGNRYESLWTVRCLLQLIDDKYDYIELESIDGDKGEGVEFILVNGLESEFHQVKLQHREGKWTLNRLEEENILSQFKKKLKDPKATCHFISISDASELRTMSNEIRKSPNNLEIRLENIKWGSHFSKLQEIWEQNDKQKTFSYLEKIYTRTDDEASLRESNRNFIQRLFDINAQDADNVSDILAQFIFERLNVKTDSSDIINHLSFRGYNIRKPDLIVDTQKLSSYLSDLINKFGKNEVADYVNLDATVILEEQANLSPPYSLIDSESTNPSKEHINDIYDAVKRFNHSVIIGAPGAGKTTTLKRIAVDAAYACLENPTNLKNNPIPLYVSLPAWEKEPDIQSFIKIHWHFEADLVELLHQGYVILYLDGLNQMGATGNARVKQIKYWLKGENSQGISSLAIRAPKYVYITCRKEDYINDFVLDIPIIEVEKLDKAHIEKFVYAYSNKDKKITERLLIQIFPEDDEQQSLESLASNPYKLKALYDIFLQNEGNLPRNAGLISKQRIQVLWDAKIKNTTYQIKEIEMIEALSRLAFAMIDSGMPTTVSKEYASLYLGSEEVLEATRDIILIVDGKEIKFDHQLTQEYFASEALNTVGISHITLSYGALITEANSKSEYFQLSDKWDEVVIALCGISDNPSEVITQIARLNPLLAQQCLESEVNVSEIDLIPSIIGALNHPNINILANAVDATIYYKDERIITPLINLLYHHNTHIRARVSNALTQLGTISISFLVAELEISYEKSRVANILSKIGYESLTYLTQLTHDTDTETLGYIYQILGEIGNPSTIEILGNALQAEEIDLKSKAIKALLQIKHQRALELLEGFLYVAETPLRLLIINGFKDNIRGSLKFHYFTIDNKDYDTLIVELLTLYSTQENNTNVLLEIISTLALIRREASVDALCTLTRHPNFSIHYSALYELKSISKSKIKGKTKAKKIVSLFGSFRYNKLRLLNKAIERLYENFGVIGLIHALNHNDIASSKRWTVAKAIIRLPQEDNTLILELLENYNNSNGYLIHALSHRGNIFADYILENVNNSSDFIRGQAVKALGTMTYKQALSLLISALDDKETVYSSSKTRVCDYAAEALEKIGAERGLRAVQNWREKEQGNSEKPPSDM